MVSFRSISVLATWALVCMPRLNFASRFARHSTQEGESYGPASVTVLVRRDAQMVERTVGFATARTRRRAATTSKRTMLGLAVSSRQMRALRASLSQGEKRSIGNDSNHRSHLRKRRRFRQWPESDFASAYDNEERGDPKEEGPPLSMLALKDLHRTEYTGLIGVGTTLSGQPQATLQVMFDTGSADLWVASDFCHTYPCGSRAMHLYNHSRSKTFRQPPPNEEVDMKTSYSSGVIHGMLGFDDIRIGSLVVHQQPFGLITQEDGNAFSLTPFDGIVGLGFPSLGSGPTTPLFESLVLQDALPRNRQEFALYLHRDFRRGGAVLWGGVDHRLFDGDLMWFPVEEEKYWSIRLLSFAVGCQVFNFTGVPRPQLIIDSGTTCFSADGAVYKFISGLVGSPTRCSSAGALPSLVYTLSGINGIVYNFTVPASEYMVHTGGRFFGGGGDACLPAIINVLSDSDRSLMILGEVFLRHYFAVFRRRAEDGRARIGLARARFDVVADSVFTGRQE